MPQRDTKWITVALALSTASTGPQIVALSLLMPEIIVALKATVPQLGQLNTAFSVVAIIGSIVMGAITVRYPPKRLLVTGITALLIGIIGTSLSTGYTQMVLFFVFYGVGTSLTLPIVSILLTLYPQEQRTTALGRIYSGRSITSILATPIIGFIAALYGWRTGYIGFGAPLILIAAIMVTAKIPEQPTSEGNVDLMRGFRKVAANRSALACIAGAALSLAFFNSLMVFNGTYMRNTLGLSLETASIAMSVTFIAVAVGQVLSGTFADRIGIKTTTWLSTLIGGISLFLYFSVKLPVALAILASAIGTGMAGTTMTTMATLALEQVPESRGTMMSLNSAAMNTGGMLSTVIGGVAISRLGFTGYGAIMFTISLAATTTFYAWTREF
ncbi:MFS transporter [Candidatus Bathyarchaeota archaeon]|nr:MFS transporter [Candidatus Bathyarchaeota archaeon]MBT4320337.1 MFS transporter [Candidatus Bathyarchaeota archaeon]MBT4424424.1 MFS transporter [Candidatus Bathyarchaeota archaeon]MBT5642903.1 MFS transporter [Candidatus Bathyarchaeota archaeon]MBT6604808.1 MFS transporter [Candidatus Bathyarchaeota archaeon]